MSEDETGGYVGLKKAAEEEKEKEKDSNSNGNGFGDWGKKKGAADGEERTSSTLRYQTNPARPPHSI